MRRVALAVLVLTFAASAFAKDVYLSIGGSVGVFRTDMRIFNPSTTKSIDIQAYLLPVGGGDNSGVTPKTITVGKRQMAVYDDVVSSLFQSSGLGGIRLSSADDFVATQRIYAGTSSGTLGQFVGGVDATAAKKTGVLIQLKVSTAFRTNIGMVNPNSVVANTSWRLYDKNNALIGATKNSTLQPFAVISPQEMRGFFGTPEASAADLSDAWISYTSDQPIVAYASVVDNGTTDPTYIPASEDSGVTSNPTTNQKTITVVARNGHFDISGQVGLAVNDVVTVNVTITEGPHGFALIDPEGIDAIPSHAGSNPGTTFSETFTVRKQGTYTYFCTNSFCGAHTGMAGTFDIGKSTDPPNPGY